MLAIDHPRFASKKPLGFDLTAQILTMDMDHDIRVRFLDLVYDVARKHGHNHAKAFRMFMSRLTTLVRRRVPWAVEVDKYLREQSRDRQNSTTPLAA